MRFFDAGRRKKHFECDSTVDKDTMDKGIKGESLNSVIFIVIGLIIVLIGAVMIYLGIQDNGSLEIKAEACNISVNYTHIGLLVILLGGVIVWCGRFNVKIKK